MIDRRDIPALLMGITATLVGIGLARFAYTPLLPALIQEQWFSSSQAVYLGAANLLGYLIGALAAHTLSERYSPKQVISLSLVAIALSFLLCAYPISFSWFFVWRLISGIAGATLMVVGPSMALAATPIERRANIGAWVFTGIGLGAFLAAWVVPLLLSFSLLATWAVLGGLCIAAGGVCHACMKSLPNATPPLVNTTNHANTPVTIPALLVGLVMVAYALDGIGFVPHTVFWVDFLARESGLGKHAASFQWGIFGIGAISGPLIAGIVAQHLGWHRGLTIAFMLKAVAIALPLLSLSIVSQSASSFLVGAMIPSIVALTSGRLSELVGPTMHKKYWGYATAVFAAAQAISGYGMSALYIYEGTYTPLFAIGACALAVGSVLLLFSFKLQAHFGIRTNH